MIRVKLKGRIGNNLFQYAVGRAIAERLGVPLVLDATFLREKVWCDSSSLYRLPIKASIIRKPKFTDRIIRKVCKNRLTFSPMNIVRESDEGKFDIKILSSSNESFLIGYFQSESYFEKISEIIRSEINFQNLSWSDISNNMAKKIVSTQSVAVHVRRTDYLKNEDFNICTMLYYQRAIKKLKDIDSNAVFYIFSDDPSWCRDQYFCDNQVIIDMPTQAADPLHDLYLMSCARHHIIANSSYSWWAAWLGKKPGQRVFCPSQWAKDEARFPIADKLCENWEVIPICS